MSHSLNVNPSLPQSVSLTTEQMTKNIKDFLLCESKKGQKRKHEDDDIQILGSVSFPMSGQFLLRQRVMQNIGPYLKVPPDGKKVEQDYTKLKLNQLEYVRKEVCNLSDSEKGQLKSATQNKKHCHERSFPNELSLSNNVVVEKNSILDLSKIEHVCTSTNSNLTVTPNEEVGIRIKTKFSDSSSEIVNIQNRINMNSVSFITPSIPSSVVTRLKIEPKNLVPELVVIQINSKPDLMHDSDNTHKTSDQDGACRVITNIKKEHEDAMSKTVSICNYSSSDLLPDISRSHTKSHVPPFSNETDSVIKKEPVKHLYDPEYIGNKSHLKSGCASPELFEREIRSNVKLKQEPVDNEELNRNKANSLGISNMKVEPIENVTISNSEQGLMSSVSEPSELSFNRLTNPVKDKPKGGNAPCERLAICKSHTLINQESFELNEIEESTNNLFNTVEENKDAAKLNIFSSSFKSKSNKISENSTLNIGCNSNEQLDTAEVREEHINIRKNSSDDEDKTWVCDIQNVTVVGYTVHSDRVVKNVHGDLVPLGNQSCRLTANIENNLRETIVSPKRFVIVNGIAMKCSSIKFPMKIQFDGIWNKKGENLIVIVMWTGIKKKYFQYFHSNRISNRYASSIDYVDVEGKFCGILDKNLKTYIRVNEFDLTLECSSIGGRFRHSNIFRIPDNAFVNLYIRKTVPHNSEPKGTIFWLILDLTKMENAPNQMLFSSLFNNKSNENSENFTLGIGCNSSEQLDTAEVNKENIKIKKNSSNVIGDKKVLSNINNVIVIDDSGHSDHDVVRNVHGDLVPIGNRTYKLTANIENNLRETTVSYKKYVIVNEIAMKCSSIKFPMKIQFDGIWNKKEQHFIVIVMWTGVKPKYFQYSNEILNNCVRSIDYVDVDGKFCSIFDKKLKTYICVNEFNLTIEGTNIGYKFRNSNNFRIPQNAFVNLYFRKRITHNNNTAWTILWLILDLTRKKNKHL